MPTNALKITGGVVVNETQALNEAGVSKTQLVRLKPDPQGLTLVEKLGGWSRFLASQITSVVRAILGWEDTNANKWIAYGTSSSSSSSLIAINCLTNGSGITTASGASTNLSPQYISNTIPIVFTTTAGSSQVNISDPTSLLVGNINTIFISTPVSVGGLVIYGQYNILPIAASGATTYAITSTDILGNLLPATYSTIASPITITGGTVSGSFPSTITFTFGALGSAPFILGEGVKYDGISPLSWNGVGIVQSCTTTQVVVASYQQISGTYISGGTLTNYGSTPTLWSGAGQYNVNVVSPSHSYNVGDTFSILTPTSLDGFVLYGNYLIVKVSSMNAFQISTSHQFNSSVNSQLGALLVKSGSSTTTQVTLVCDPIYAPPTIVINSGSSTTTAVTLGYATGTYNAIAVGSTIYVSGIVYPSSWNGTWVVTGSTKTSVTFALSGSALSWSSGGTISFPLFSVGATINVAGVYPFWNGAYTVVTSTNNSVTYSLAGSAVNQPSLSGSVSLIGGNENIVISTGVGTYAVGSAFGATGTNIFASNWALDNWGEALIACPIGFTPVASAISNNVAYGPIYAWDPVSGIAKMTLLANGPPASNGAFVAMPQRQIIAWGTTFAGVIDPLLIRWCDVSNYNVWIGQVTNQAGSYRLSTGSVIVGAIQAQQQGLIWTDISLWSMQYIGPPYVYSFNQLGQGCGLIARRAMGIMEGTTYWMGRSQFFMLNANGIEPVPCPIWDVVFQDLDLANLAKITCAVNSLFNEITWYYPVAGGSGENSAYIKYNAMLNAWDFGTLGRTAWIDNSVLGPPIGYDPVNQLLYQHEISPDADGAAMLPSFTTGYFAIAEGDQKAFLDQWWPDFKWGYYNQAQSATISITLNGCDYPGDTPTTYGPYTVTQATKWFSPRIRNRLLSVTVSSSDAGTWWRTGNNRYRVMSDGKF